MLDLKSETLNYTLSAIVVAITLFNIIAVKCTITSYKNNEAHFFSPPDLVFIARASSGWRFTTSLPPIFPFSTSSKRFPLNSEKIGANDSLANNAFCLQFNIGESSVASKSNFTEFLRFLNAGGTRGVVDGVVRETMSCESKEFTMFDKFCKKV